MASSHPIEANLRPAVEIYTAYACGLCAFACVVSPWMLALAPSVGYGMAGGFMVFGGHRFIQAWRVVRYRRGMRRLRRFAVSSRQIPVSKRYLWIGRGFEWQVQHTRRLYESQQPEAQQFLRPSRIYRTARALEAPLERRHLTWFVDALRADTIFNPVRPLPPVGGNPVLHAVEPNETDIYMPLADRGGHTLVQGTTGVGKTRLAEVFVTQDIRRQIHGGEVVIVIDPKGDADLMKRMYVEAQRAGRLDAFRVFHLGYPEVSARYNAVGRFGRISEVATRLSGQLSGEGNSAAFREFAWRFVNIVARARHALGYRPTYEQILADVVAIDELMIEYGKHALPAVDETAWQQIIEIEGGLNEKKVPRNMQGRDYRVVAIEIYLQRNKVADPVLAGLRSAVRYDKTYFDKIVASLLPLLEKLTTGKTAELLSPDYNDIDDERPIFDWRQVIRQRGVVYVGLDALSDFEVAQAVGNSMFADLVSVAGDIYKRGVDDGLPGADPDSKPVINLHCDEFNELIGDEFIPLMNKGRGAGIQITAYTQTLSDIEARLGNAPKARQVIGNFNNVIMLRVREETTAQLLTRQLHQVMVSQRMLVSMASDNSDVDTDTDFSSSGGDRVSTQQVPMLEPSDIIRLPKGQAFALLDGGTPFKIRMPLPKAEDSAELPSNLSEIADRMRERYQTADHWWDDVAPPPITIDNTSSGATSTPVSEEATPEAARPPAPTVSAWAGDDIHDAALDIDDED